MLEPNESLRALRTSGSGLLWDPRVRIKHNEVAIQVCEARIWNSLAEDVRQASTLMYKIPTKSLSSNKQWYFIFCDICDDCFEQSSLLKINLVIFELLFFYTSHIEMREIVRNVPYK